MRILVIALAIVAYAGSADAFRVTELNGRHVQLYPTRGQARPGGGGKQPNLTYHNGPVIHQARVVPIFWGPTWQSSGSPSALAQSIVAFFGQFGTNPQYNVITQYYDFSGSIQQTNLGSTYWIDTSTPPTSVTDATIQSEVQKAIGQIGLDANAVYEVFLPSTSYATYGTANSCGGPNLQFCAYHSNFGYSGADVKYASMPYPSCSGCKWTGWTDAQNFEHFACHETREAVTDPDGTAWWDRSGNEADDKCAWSPSPFLANGYGYQYEWSNSARACVK